MSTLVVLAFRRGAGRRVSCGGSSTCNGSSCSSWDDAGAVELGLDGKTKVKRATSLVGEGAWTKRSGACCLVSSSSCRFSILPSVRWLAPSRACSLTSASMIASSATCSKSQTRAVSPVPARSRGEDRLSAERARAVRSGGAAEVALGGAGGPAARGAQRRTAEAVMAATAVVEAEPGGASVVAAAPQPAASAIAGGSVAPTAAAGRRPVEKG